jgi:SIR2-like domain
MKFINKPDITYPFMLREQLTEDFNIPTDENYQCIYKLHGSYNWLSESEGERLVVIGGNKVASIASSPVLARYQSEFKLKLTEADSILMVIGYSFSDTHINRIIVKAVSSGLKYLS